MDRIDIAIDKAIHHGEAFAEHEPRALSARFETSRKRLVVELSTGAELSITPHLLHLAEDADLSDVQVMGGGFDLYFPKIDEGAFVPDICRFAFDMKIAA